jgi:hypothetical protein
MTRYYIGPEDKPKPRAALRVRYPVTVFVEKLAFYDEEVKYRLPDSSDTHSMTYNEFCFAQKVEDGFFLTYLVHSDTADFELMELSDVASKDSGEAVQRVRKLVTVHGKKMVVNNASLVILPPREKKPAAKKVAKKVWKGKK